VIEDLMEDLDEDCKDRMLLVLACELKIRVDLLLLEECTEKLDVRETLLDLLETEDDFEAEPVLLLDGPSAEVVLRLRVEDVVPGFFDDERRLVKGFAEPELELDEDFFDEDEELLGLLKTGKDDVLLDVDVRVERDLLLVLWLVIADSVTAAKTQRKIKIPINEGICIVEVNVVHATE